VHAVRHGCATALLVALLASFGATAHGADVTVYEETFPSTGVQPPSQDEKLRLEGWCGGNAGDQFCNNPPGTVANQGGEGAISVGFGQDGERGFAFWSQTRINADSFLYTEEFAGTSNLSELTWYQRDGSNTSDSDPMRVAFKIGSTWYISTTVWTQPNNAAWVEQTADLLTLGFFARPQIGTILPDGGVPGPGPAVFLPDGQIVAFGFWWDGPKGSTSRIDNVRLVSPDDDADGVGDAVDSCLPSNAGSTVVIGSCDSAVANTVGEDGCTLADSIGACAVGAASHGTYVSCVSRATNVLQAAGLLSGREKGAIQRCAARAAIP
jgi:hypothetical protein